MDVTFVILAYALPFMLLVAAYFIGSHLEARHYQSIEARESQYLHLPLLTFDDADGQFPINEEYDNARMVNGSVVISVDRFKQFLAALRNFFGGRIGAYETLLDRGRREAILRMKERAGDASAIVNFRIETSTLGGKGGQSLGTVEVHAYGTAVDARPPSHEIHAESP